MNFSDLEYAFEFINAGDPYEAPARHSECHSWGWEPAETANRQIEARGSGRRRAPIAA